MLAAYAGLGHHSDMWADVSFMNRVSQAIACLAISVTAAGCSSVPAQGSPGASQAHETLSQATPERQTVAKVALAQVGDRYAPNMAGPKEYDDTGLTYYAYRQNGHALPRSLQAQVDAGTPIALAQADPGDLMFFRLDTPDGRGRLTVGLLADSRTAVIALPGNADQSGGVKRIDISSDYWQQRMIGVSRLLPDPTGSAAPSKN